MITTDCILISPPFDFEKGNMWKEIRTLDPPLGLAALASWIRREGFSSKIIDCQIEIKNKKFFISELESLLKREINPQVIGITCCTTTAYQTYTIAEICKHVHPYCKIVIGGPHATFATDEVIGKSFIDIAVIGEGEVTLTEILQKKELSDIKGIAYMAFGEIKKTPPRERISNPDRLPIPAYDLLKINKYQPPIGSYKQLPSMIITCSRGCPGKCTFCTKTLGYEFFQKPADMIIKEIEYLQQNFNIRDIIFHDDTFTNDRKNISIFCNLIISKKIKLSWHCFSRVNSVDEPMLHLMKSAGCHQIMYGVETFDQKVLDFINKKISINQIEETVKITKKAGIDCRLAFMVGNPGDTVESIKNNIKIAKKIDPDLIVVNIATPFPGTDLFCWGESQNRITIHDWSKYSGNHAILKIDGMTSDEIQMMYKKMYTAFYFRPKIIIKKLFKIRNINDLQILLIGFMKILSFFRRK